MQCDTCAGVNFYRVRFYFHFIYQALPNFEWPNLQFIITIAGTFPLMQAFSIKTNTLSAKNAKDANHGGLLFSVLSVASDFCIVCVFRGQHPCVVRAYLFFLSKIRCQAVECQINSAPETQ